MDSDFMFRYSKRRYRLLLIIVLFTVTDVRCQEGYQQRSLQIHNDYRSLHGVEPLVISADLNDRAVRCAQYYSARGMIDHSCPHKNGAGENLWLQFGGSPTTEEVVRSSIASWYSEESSHNYNLDYQQQTGHFSQMVWRSSTAHGFGVSYAGNIAVGCGLYSPPGNFLGQFRNNVFPPNSTSASTSAANLSNNSTTTTTTFVDNGGNSLSIVSTVVCRC